MDNTLVKLIGWKATVLHGDPCVFDRWRWLKRHLSGGRLRTLDAGCGSGAFTMYAARIGNESVGISFDETNNQTACTRAALLGVSNVQFITADLRELDRFDRQSNQFDQIICSEVIEHILNDRKLVEDLCGLLKPGGRLLLTTPFKNYKPLLNDKISSYEDGGHVRSGYTHQEMRELFSESGLTVLTEEFISGFVSQQLTNLLRLLSRVNGKVAWLLTLPLRVFQVVDVPLTKLFGYPYLCIGVVGLKRGD